MYYGRRNGCSLGSGSPHHSSGIVTTCTRTRVNTGTGLSCILRPAPLGEAFEKTSTLTSMDDVRTPIYAAEPYQEASLVESRIVQPFKLPL
jgi:hypothetical protein